MNIEEKFLKDFCGLMDKYEIKTAVCAFYLESEENQISTFLNGSFPELHLLINALYSRVRSEEHKVL